jgi:putative toxin-antitoxin system antitoxin component (TIGR02293 family)
MNKASVHMAFEGAGATSPLRALGIRHLDDLPAYAYQLIKRGLSSEWIEPVRQHLGVSNGELAELIGLGRRQVNRLSANKLSLPAHAAEMMLRLLEVHDMAVDVFGSRATACAWLSRPHPMLVGECPRTATKTSYGAAKVKDLLVATKYSGAA